MRSIPQVILCLVQYRSTSICIHLSVCLVCMYIHINDTYTLISRPEQHSRGHRASCPFQVVPMSTHTVAYLSHAPIHIHEYTYMYTHTYMCIYIYDV